MKNPKPPNSVIVTILAAATIISWVVFEIVRALTAQPPPVVPEKIIAPLPPALSSEELNKLQTRIHVGEEEINQFIPPSSSTQSNQSQQSATSEASLEQSTSSGQLQP